MKKITLLFCLILSFISVSCDIIPFTREYDDSYKKNENQYGVKFYTFNGKNPPPIEITKNGNIKNIEKINQLLSKIGEKEIEKIEDYRSKPNKKEMYNIYNTDKYSRIGHLYWDNYHNKKLDVELLNWKYNDNDNKRYICIRKIQITPNRIDKMKNMGKNNDQTMFISKDEYGDKWPFIIDECLIRCNRGSVVFLITKDREHYGLNGIALSMDKYKDSRDLLVNDPDKKQYIGRFIDKGLSLCPE